MTVMEKLATKVTQDSNEFAVITAVEWAEVDPNTSKIAMGLRFWIPTKSKRVGLEVRLNGILSLATYGRLHELIGIQDNTEGEYWYRPSFMKVMDEITLTNGSYREEEQDFSSDEEDL